MQLKKLILHGFKSFADRTEFNGKLKAKAFEPGSAVVADSNFGCGSSREQAVSTIKGHDLTIVARSIARIFLQNGINLGLKMVICPEIDAKEGDELEVTADKVVNKTSGKSFAIERLPAARQAIIDAGGLIPYTRKRVMG